jgi:hypothetical protein
MGKKGLNGCFEKHPLFCIMHRLSYDGVNYYL